MLNFDFYNPTRIIFGQGRMAELSQHIPANARVLIVVGGASAEKNGTLAQVRSALGTRAHATFGGIEPNPSYETCLRAVQQIQSEGWDFLLAVGGGSVIDAVKFIAAAVYAEGDPWDILLTHGRRIVRALPYGVVLTLPATGSEMNDGAVITHRALGAKLVFSNAHCFPRFALLDPTQTYTLPPRQLANGVVDAFVHITEQYLTYPAGGIVQDHLAEGLLQTLIQIGPRMVGVSAQEQADAAPVYEDRANLMWTASLALNGLLGAGVPQDWATHYIGHELTALYGIDHARTLALVLPALLHECRAHKSAKLLQYAQRVWGLSAHTAGSEQECITQAIERTRDFFESLAVPTRLSAYGLGESAVQAVVANLQAHHLTKLGETRDITPDVVQRILRAAL